MEEALNELRKPPASIDDGIEKLKQKFGDEADVYAENRSDAAELADNRRDAERWDEIAAKLREDGE